jgi:hypothetical protein
MADPVATPVANTDATGASIPPIVDEKPSIRSFVPGGAKADTAGIFAGELSKYYCTLSFGKFSRPKPFSSADFSPDLTICLPLPNELNDNTGVDYDNQNLEAVGDIINGSMLTGAGAAALRNSGSLLTGAGRDFAKGMQTGTGWTGAITKAIGGAIDGMIPDAAQVTSAIQQSAGLAPNPNPSVMFRGPQLREFTYTWTIFPDNKTQSEALRNMIKNIKGRVLPRSGSSDSAAVLEYPNMVQINFFPWDTAGGSSNPWGWGDNTIIRIKKCVVKSFNVNYTPTNVPAFFDSTNAGNFPHPVATNITITLQEIEYMLANDWGGGTGTGVLEKLAKGVEELGGKILDSSAKIAEAGGAYLLNAPPEGTPPANADAATATAQPGGGA